MPVQFTCSHCRRRLSVGQRKVGTTVACPKCGLPNVVPKPSVESADAPAAPQSIIAGEPGSATAAGISPAPVQPSTVPPPALAADAAFDDVLRLLTENEPSLPKAATAVMQPAPPSPPPAQLAPAMPAVTAPPPIPPLLAIDARLPSPPPVTARGAAPRRGRRDDGSVLLITRKALYAQAAIVGTLVLIAFFAGLTIGRSGRSAARSAAETKANSGEPVSLDGHVLYSLSPGHSLPDMGAIVLALPKGKQPDRKIAARGLRPVDNDDLSVVPAVEDLRTMGAAVARTDDAGEFQLVAPRPGDYTLVILSHRTERPEGRTIAMADQEELGRVFASPGELIGQQRYAILSRRLAGAPSHLTHEFGPVDKK
jgi:hypothetical protein